MKGSTMSPTTARSGKKSASGKAATHRKSANPATSTGNGLDRESMIAVAAYYIAEHRGFDGGDPLADWLAAEAEIDAALNHPDEVIIH
jgi:hypothetical protein